MIPSEHLGNGAYAQQERGGVIVTANGPCGDASDMVYLNADACRAFIDFFQRVTLAECAANTTSDIPAPCCPPHPEADGLSLA